MTFLSSCSEASISLPKHGFYYAPIGMLRGCEEIVRNHKKNGAPDTSEPRGNGCTINTYLVIPVQTGIRLLQRVSKLLCNFSRSSLFCYLSGSVGSLSSSLLAATFFSLLAAFGLLSLFAALTLAFSGFLAATHSANGYKCDKQNFLHLTKRLKIKALMFFDSVARTKIGCKVTAFFGYAQKK